MEPTGTMGGFEMFAALIALAAVVFVGYHVGGAIIAFITEVIDLVSAIFNGIVAFFTFLFEIIGEIFKAIVAIFDLLYNIVEGIITGIQLLFAGIFAVFAFIFENLTVIMWIFVAGAVVVAVSAGGEALLIIIPVVGIVVFSRHHW